MRIKFRFVERRKGWWGGGGATGAVAAGKNELPALDGLTSVLSEAPKKALATFLLTRLNQLLSDFGATLAICGLPELSVVLALI